MEEYRVNQIASEILSILRRVTTAAEDKVIYAAYLLYKKACNRNLNVLSLAEKDGVVPGAVRFVNEENDIASVWNALVPLSNVYSSDGLAGVVLHYECANNARTGSFSTPESISTLACLMLGVEKGETVVDLGCAAGDYIVEANRMNPENNIVGVEQNSRCVEIAQMRADVLGEHVNIRLGDAFDDSFLRTEETKKIFCNPPFNLRLLDLGPAAQRFVKSSDFASFGFTPTTRAEWVFAALECASMGADGRAVAVMPVGALFTASSCGTVRKNFVKKGLVEAVVLLPERMFAFSGVSTALVVFSKGNESIRFVDASCLYESGRQCNYIGGEQIDAVYDAFLGDGEFSKSVACEDLLNGECDLSPKKYLVEEPVVENATPLGSVIASVKRGATITSKQMGTLTSDVPMPFRYLSLSSITNGMLNEPLPSLKEIPADCDRFCIKKRSLVMGKVGTPFKMAVVEPNRDYQVLVNGNLYIIEFNEKEANPYYVKAVLESEWGTKMLQQQSQGSVIPNISVEKLMALSIPLPDIERQNELAEIYVSIQEKIARLKEELSEKMGELDVFCNEIMK